MSDDLVTSQLSEATQSRDAEHPTRRLRSSPLQQRLDALQQIILTIHRATNVKAALPEVARAMVETLDLHTVSFGVTRSGWVARWGPESEDLLVSQIDAVQFNSAQLLDIHHVALCPIATEEMFSYEAFDSTEAGRAICLPVVVNGTKHAIMLVTVRDGDSIDENLVETLTAIAGNLSAGFEREQRLANINSLANDEQGLSHIFEIIARLAMVSTLDNTIQPILADIADLFAAHSATLVVMDRAEIETYTSALATPNSLENPSLSLATASIIGQAISTHQIQSGRIPNRYDVGGLDRLALGAPVISRGEAIGVLLLERPAERAFTRTEHDVAATLARHISFGLERERRMQTYFRQSLLFSLVERVTASVARSTAADDLFAQMAREIRLAFGYDCSIAMIEDNRLHFLAIEMADSAPLPDWINEGIPLSLGIMGRVARTGEPVFIPDVSSDPAFLDTGQGTGSEIAVPIRVADEVVGVINIESSRSNPLESLDFEIMLVLANHIGIALNNRQLLASERESRMAIEAIQRISTIIAETLDPDESLRRIAETLGETMGYPTVSLSILEGSELVLKANYGSDPAKMPVSINIADGVSGRVARTGRPVFIPNVDADPDYVRIRPDLTSEICVPIRCNGEIVGILNVEGTAERPLAERDLHLLTTFAEHAGVLLNNALAYAALSREATLDPMTGVPNLRYFQQQLQIEMDRARRDGNPLSLVVIDMDYLKQINDSFGHLAGDQVLRELAKRMSAQLRGVDLLARYAGDEFVAILPGVNEHQALEIAQRLIDAARNTPFTLPDGPPVDLSISVGLASFPDDAGSSTELLRAADMAMYVAKESGKNRVSTARQSAQMRRHSER